jgi:hypothetical protein
MSPLLRAVLGVVADLLYWAAVFLMMLLLFAMLAGCSTTEQVSKPAIIHGLIPDMIDLETIHVSHATTGSIGCRSACKEDALTAVSVSATWRLQGFYVTVGEGYNVRGRNGGGFYGPGEVTTVRAGYSFQLKDR